MKEVEKQKSSKVAKIKERLAKWPRLVEQGKRRRKTTKVQMMAHIFPL